MPDDETINQMLARSEEEFNIYQVHTYKPSFMMHKGVTFMLWKQLKKLNNGIAKLLFGGWGGI